MCDDYDKSYLGTILTWNSEHMNTTCIWQTRNHKYTSKWRDLNYLKTTVSITVLTTFRIENILTTLSVANSSLELESSERSWKNIVGATAQFKREFSNFPSFQLHYPRLCKPWWYEWHVGKMEKLVSFYSEKIQCR